MAGVLLYFQFLSPFVQPLITYATMLTPTEEKGKKGEGGVKTRIKKNQEDNETGT